MDRINGANTIDIGGGLRGFRDRNAVDGLAGTEVTADFLNDVQEELLKVITEAGLVPDEDDATQLWQAISAMIKARYFRLSSASGNIPSNVMTRIRNFAGNSAFMPDSVISASNGTVTIGTKDAGVYALSASAWVASAGLIDILQIRVNGAGVTGLSMQSTSDVSEQDPACATVIRLAAGDVVDAAYVQYKSSPGNNALVVDPGCHLAGVRIGA